MDALDEYPVKHVVDVYVLELFEFFDSQNCLQ